MTPFIVAATLALRLHSPLACTEPGVRLWNLKSTIPKPSSLIKAPLIPLADMLALPYPDPMPKTNLKTRKRIALVANAHSAKEGDMVRTRGWLRLVATED